MMKHKSIFAVSWSLKFWALSIHFTRTASRILPFCLSSPQVLLYHHLSLHSHFWWERGCRVLLLSQISTKTSRSSESSIQTQCAHPMLGMDTAILHSQAGRVAWEHPLPNTWDPPPGAQTGSSKPHCQQSSALPLRFVKSAILSNTVSETENILGF